jgi:hypothetical protein
MWIRADHVVKFSTNNGGQNSTSMSLSMSVSIDTVRDGARFKNKLMGVMVYFSPTKVNINQYYKSDSLDAGIVI